MPARFLHDGVVSWAGRGRNQRRQFEVVEAFQQVPQNTRPTVLKWEQAPCLAGGWIRCGPGRRSPRGRSPERRSDSERAGLANHGRDGLGQNTQVEQQGPPVDVLPIQPYHLLEVHDPASPLHLPQASDAPCRCNCVRCGTRRSPPGVGRKCRSDRWRAVVVI